MKELRPGSTGRTEVRVLFAFEKERQAVLLLGGDKSQDWASWYQTNIAIADDRVDEHQAAIDERRAASKTAAKGKDRGAKGRRR